jgi:sulfite reductase subunit B
MIKNEYLPFPAIIENIRKETFDISTFRLQFIDNAYRNAFTYKEGQFIELSIPGVGEAPFSITSSPLEEGFFELTIRKIGRVTKKLFELKTGEIVYIRGPYGNSFPLSEMRGKNLYFIAGGIGLAPLRSVINTALKKRDEYGEIKILYGAKTPDEICYKDEIKSWKKFNNTEVLLTVDTPTEEWDSNVGVVTTLMDKAKLDPGNCTLYVCGPPIMLHFVILRLLENQFNERDIYVSLERYMQCGIGKCGHCNIGDKFVCIDGPVFSYNEIKNLPEKERAI